MGSEYEKESEEVARYYDEWQQAYAEVYGDTIQAFRPAKKDELMRYVARSADIQDAQNILDAGCGVGGPSIWLAENFEVKITGVTISALQAQKAREEVEKAGLSERVNIIRGDYHSLSGHLPSEIFDRVLFLESL